MNDDTILQLGGFCTELLGSEMFDALIKMHSQQCASDMLRTQPHEQKKRESIYAAYQGLEEFLALLQDFSKAHTELLKQQEKTADHSEAHIDEIDDPSVHDIYGMNPTDDDGYQE
jgi:hypothetical protein